MALRFPPVSQFLARFRAVLARRTRFDFDAEVAGLSRVEQAVAFLALLELGKSGEVLLSQAAPLAPIRVVRAGSRFRRASADQSGAAPETGGERRISVASDERTEIPWTARSA